MLLAKKLKPSVRIAIDITKNRVSQPIRNGVTISFLRELNIRRTGRMRETILEQIYDGLVGLKIRQRFGLVRASEKMRFKCGQYLIWSVAVRMATAYEQVSQIQQTIAQEIGVDIIP